MHHLPYAKIPEGTLSWNLDEAAHREMGRTEWVVTEKVHGANFCLVTDGTGLRFAKRKAFLADGEDFFGHLLLWEELETAALAAFAALADQEVTELRIYGELHGGGYPHPDVPADPQVQPVQTGIWYHPSIRFACFDMAAATAEEELGFLGIDTVGRVCTEANLTFMPPLFRGKFTEALQYPLGFSTQLPRIYGLPELPDNLAEGIVIKPAVPFLIQGPKGLFRPVVKRKLPRFSEDARFHQSESWTAGKAAAESLTVDDAFLAAEVAPLLTKARLQAAISKVGRLSPRTRGRIARELQQDIVEEISQRFPQLPADDMERIREWVSPRARDFVRR